MINYIIGNPAILISIIIFVICIVIGFVANIYMVKAGKIGKIFEDDIKKEKAAEDKDDTKIEE